MDKIDFVGPILRTIAKVVIPKKRYKSLTYSISFEMKYE